VVVKFFALIVMRQVRKRRNEHYAKPTVDSRRTTRFGVLPELSGRAQRCVEQPTHPRNSQHPQQRKLHERKQNVLHGVLPKMRARIHRGVTVVNLM